VGGWVGSDCGLDVEACCVWRLVRFLVCGSVLRDVFGGILWCLQGFDEMGKRLFGKIMGLGGLICVGNVWVMILVKKNGDLVVQVSLGWRFTDLGRKIGRASLGRKRRVWFGAGTGFIGLWYRSTMVYIVLRWCL